MRKMATILRLFLLSSCILTVPIQAGFWDYFFENWSTPITISESNSITFLPQFSSGNENTGIAAWLVYQNKEYELTASIRNEMGWSSPYQLLKTRGKFSNLQVYQNESGTGLIVFVLSEDGNATVWTVIYDGIWQSPIPLSNKSPDIRAISLALNSEGEALVAWNEYDLQSTSYVIKYAEYSNYVWQTPIKLTDHCQKVSQPIVHLSDQSKGVAIWNDSNTLLYAIRTNGVWDVLGSIPTGEYTPLNFQAAFSNQSGDGIAVWVAAGSKQNPVIASSLFQNGNWTKSNLISEQNSSSIHPSLSCNDLGDAVVVWQKREGDQFSIQSRFHHTNQWSGIENISNEPVFNKKLSIAINNTGQAQLSWAFKNKSMFSIQAAFFDGMSWSSQETLNSSPYMTYLPTISLDDSGNAACVWSSATKDHEGTVQYLQRTH